MRFPYIEVEASESRPVLIVSRAFAGPRRSLQYAMMVTNAANRGWPDDISLEADHADYGLSRPSLPHVAKVTSIEIFGATPIGKPYGAKLEEVCAALQAALTS